MRRAVLIVLALALGGYIAWDRVEAHRLKAAIDAIAVPGETTEPKTAEQKEAAALYAQAADLAYQRALDENGRAARLDVDAPGGTEIPLDEIRTSHRGGDPALQLLDRVTPMDFHGFAPDQRATDTPQQSSLEAGLSDLGLFACLRADLASIGGDADLAVAALVPCVRLQRTLSRPSSQSAHSVRILGSLRIFFRHVQAPDSALATLQRAMDSWPEEDTMLRSTLIDRRRYAEIATSRLFFGVGPWITGIVFHPFRLASMRRVLPAFDGPIANATPPWSERWKIVDQQQRAQIQEVRRRQQLAWFTRMTDPFRSPFVWSTMWIQQSAYELAARRIAALAVSLERYRRAHDGILPASIDAPEDPFSGQPLIVKHDAGAYVIYSVDINHKDDGGVLYGFGAAGLSHYGTQTPRDFGIRVPIRDQGPGTRDQAR